MAKKFDTAGSNDSFAKVNDKSRVKAQVVTIVNIESENLIDNPDNGEDIEYTADLELSIEQNGFTDPLDVTDFGMEDGKYMIVAGHRRRNAGTKLGMKIFPCIVRHFETRDEMINCMLLSQSFRDSSKDPLLYARRWKLHEKYLEESGFKGSKRDEIARRLGISVQQADRYANMDKIIFPVWDMIEAGVVSVSAVQPLATHTSEEQMEILAIMTDAEADGQNLTRECVSKIVDAYRRDDETDWNKVKKMDAPKPAAGSVATASFVNDEPASREGYEPKERARNDEMRREYDPIAAEYDKMDADRAAWEREQKIGQSDEGGEADDAVDEPTFKNGQTHLGCDENKNGAPDSEMKGAENRTEESEESERDKRIRRGNELFAQLGKLDKFFSAEDEYMAEDDADAEKLIGAMATVAEQLIVNMNNVAVERGLEAVFIEKKILLKDVMDGCA